MAEYFYMRINTPKGRGKKRAGRKETALQRYAVVNGLQYDENTVYKEVSEEGREWDELEKILHEGDTIIFKDLCGFVQEAEDGCMKYMMLMGKGITLVFLDNPTLNTEYIKRLFDVSKGLDFVDSISRENIITLLMQVELDRIDQERLERRKWIKEGMDASGKKPGRKEGTMEKLTPELADAIAVYLQDGSVLQIDLMKKFNISRNTLKKYAKFISKKLKQQS